MLKGALLISGLLAAAAWSQERQNPSPMVEHTRAHPRLARESPDGRREKLDLGTLFIPKALDVKGKVPLFVHFHGAGWVAEVAAAKDGRTAVIAMSLGVGSGAYSKAFADPLRFGKLLKEAEAKAGVQFEPITLTAWSAGYGAVRELLKQPQYFERVQGVLLLDGLHTGYVDGKPGPLESRLQTDTLDIFVQFAREAVAEKKRMIVTHTEVFPGTFASATETADYLLKQLGLRRTAILIWGPMQTQILSEIKKGKFLMLGFAGNSAPDHVDQLHALPELLRLVQ